MTRGLGPSCLQPGRLLTVDGHEAGARHRTHRALGIPLASYAKGSLGRKLHTWPVVGDVQKPSSNRMWWEPILAGIQRQEGNTLGLTDYHLPSLHKSTNHCTVQHATRSLPVTSPVRGRYAEAEEQQ